MQQVLNFCLGLAFVSAMQGSRGEMIDDKLIYDSSLMIVHVVMKMCRIVAEVF
jgi:hypothetical protein